MIKAVIFDLDGTLADTVESIAYSANRALVQMGLSPFEKEKFCYFAGDGSDELIRRCLRERQDIQCTRFEEMRRIYRELFKKDCMYRVKPYEGICSMLEELKRQKILICVLSNKPHTEAVHVVETLFAPDYFDYIQGQQEGIRRKPSPDGVSMITKHFGLGKNDCLYVGDTSTDMQTGNAAGMYTVGVLWGFRTRQELTDHHAAVVIEHPAEILDIVRESKND